MSNISAEEILQEAKKDCVCQTGSCVHVISWIVGYNRALLAIQQSESKNKELQQEVERLNAEKEGILKPSHNDYSIEAHKRELWKHWINCDQKKTWEYFLVSTIANAVDEIQSRINEIKKIKSAHRTLAEINDNLEADIERKNEALRLLKDSIDLAEQEYGANYVITTEDIKIIDKALSPTKAEE